VFVDPQSCPNYDQERARYQTHNNNFEDEGYRNFLKPFWQPFETKAPCKILDFGSGPQPALSEQLRRLGHRVWSYDPFFAPLYPQDQKFDFIFCCEVIEHCRDPLSEIKKMLSVLKPNGEIWIRTELLELSKFPTWWYVRDPTHICFFSEKTFREIAQALGLELIARGPLQVFRSSL
jgi:2-polyprenyl-3-methyl-5-hydroxy-6-metoxy-1,4-benzoquinol methylase